jgi:hypothetical protein
LGTVIETTGERWYEAEVHRIGGEIALLMPNPEAAKAEAYFERALAVARQQQPKSTARSDRVPSSGSFPLLPVSPASGATKANALRPGTCVGNRAAQEIERLLERTVVFLVWRYVGLRAGLFVAFRLEVEH